MAKVTKNTLKLIIPYFRRYKWQYLFGTVCLILIIGGQLLVPQYIKNAINALTSSEDIVRSVISNMLSILLITLGLMLARFGWRHFLGITGRKIERDLRATIYRHFLTLSKADYSAESTSGNLLAILNNDVQAVRMACSFGLVSFTDGVVMGGAIIILLLIQYQAVSWYILSPLLVIIVMVAIGGKLITKSYTKVQTQYAAITQEIKQSISGIQEIKSFGKESFFANRFNRIINRYKQASLGYTRVFSLMFPLILFFSGLSNILLIFFGGRLVVTQQLTIGDFVAIFTYLEMLIWPMIGAGYTMNVIAQGIASLKRINTIVNIKPSISNPTNPIYVSSNPQLMINNLHYAYPNNVANPIIDNISLTIPSGEYFGIIGRTGSGKSTLAKLLSNNIKPPPQSVFVDQHDINAIDIYQLKSLVHLIPQEAFLFSDTIKNNILYGSPGANDESFDAAIEQTALNRMTDEFLNQFETEIGEKGVMLSGGQRQRIALARNLLVNPAILILDDTLSALDNETAHNVTKNIKQYRNGKTTIIITNKIQAALECNSVVVIEQGVVTQSGRPSDLLGQPGLFRQLWLLQNPKETA